MNRFWYLPPEARKILALLVLIVGFLHQKRAFPKGLLVPIHQKCPSAAGHDLGLKASDCSSASKVLKNLKFNYKNPEKFNVKNLKFNYKNPEKSEI